ncbi:polysaccharide deacetylase family protein [Mangrovibacterium diazotrophicum]|uniref:Polysaccharide deacetylase n=1 Tax=Mangrovibacterium diazotrophicum TaxID=1261403 RepID=A0A419WB75_9BACT|nr:polysaccharide deacetylase family protein [Mangrovibacterium diazotrophicum]RKD92674.1 polysaccharide deacetylase [Mangrovibacterium diazotrophicum]
MNEISQQLISELAVMTPFSLLKSGKSTPVLLPFYHLVTDESLAFRSNYDYPSVAQFEADLDFLLKHFKPLSLGDLLKGGDLSHSFHLSFDDGLKECYEIVAPILKRKGVPATFFINPSFVDNKDLFHRYKASEIIATLKARNIQISLQRTYADLASLDEMAEEIGLNWESWLEEKKPYMSMEQVKSLVADGFTVGSHSMDHPEFELLDEETQLEEIRESMDWVNRKLKPEIKAFAFPFTDVGVSDAVFEACRDEGIFDISFGTAGIKREHFPFHFQRLPMESKIELSTKKRLKEAYMAYRLKRVLGKHYARRF